MKRKFSHPGHSNVKDAADMVRRTLVVEGFTGSIASVIVGAKPQRFQLSRKKGFKLPPNTVVVTRGPGKLFGNPFLVKNVIEFFGKQKAQQACVDSFREWLNESTEGSELKPLIRAKLRGKNLACWCPLGSPCHADVLLEIANK